MLHSVLLVRLESIYYLAWLIFGPHSNIGHNIVRCIIMSYLKKLYRSSDPTAKYGETLMKNTPLTKLIMHRNSFPRILMDYYMLTSLSFFH